MTKGVFSLFLILSCFATSFAFLHRWEPLPASLEFKRRVAVTGPTEAAGKELPAEILFKRKDYYFQSPVTEALFAGNKYYFYSPGKDWVQFTLGRHNYSYITINDLIIHACDRNLQGDTIAETSYGKYYCFKDSTSTINEINPSNGFSIVKSYFYPQELKFFSLNNDFVIMSSPTIDGRTYYMTFDTKLKQYTCSVHVDDTFVLGSIAIDNYLIMATNKEKAVLEYVAIDCTDLTNVTVRQVFPDLSGGVSWQALNDSSVLVNFVRSHNQLFVIPMKYMNNIFMMAGSTVFMADPDILSTGFNLKYNDTHFLMTYLDPAKRNMLGLFYIDENMNLITAKSMPLADFAASVAGIVRIKGTNYILVNLQSMGPRSHTVPTITGFMKIDVNTFEIVDVQSLFQFLEFGRFRFKNGAIVDLSLLGVSVAPLDNPNTRVFYPYPAWDYWVNPGHDDIIWGMYTPNYSSRPGFTECYLSRIQRSTGAVDRVFIKPVCSCSFDNYEGGRLFKLLDVYVDSDGYHNVAYRCGSSYFIIVGHVLHEIRDEDYDPNAQEPLVYVDYLKGLFRIIDFAHGSVIFKTYDINSGAILDSIVLAQCLSCLQVGAKVTRDIAIFTNKTDTLAVTPVVIFRISDKNFLFRFNLPSPTVDRIVPLAIDFWHTTIAWLFVASFTDRPLYVFTPYGQSTDVPGFHYGSINIHYVSNYTFALEKPNGWISEMEYYYAKPNWIRPASAGILTMSLALIMLVIVGLLV